MREELIELGKWFYHLALAVAVAGIVKPLLDQHFSWYAFGVAFFLMLALLLTGFILIKKGRTRDGSFYS